jgi:hypothetical protein
MVSCFLHLVLLSTTCRCILKKRLPAAASAPCQREQRMQLHHGSFCSGKDCSGIGKWRWEPSYHCSKTMRDWEGGKGNGLTKISLF